MTKDPKLNIVYITARDKSEARKIGRELVRSRLVACVNIINNMNSIYWWGGKLQDDHESIIIAKTMKSLVPGVIKKVRSIHSYACPCVISVPVLGGSSEYIEWVKRETRPGKSK